MFTRTLLWAIFTALLTAVGAPGADDSWSKLMTLVGEWEGEEGGKKATVTYTMISGGNALMESMKMPAPEPDMVTIYHKDGDALVATHYCSIGNQPRMRTSGNSPDGNSIRFRFADITNLTKPTDGYIRHLTVTIVDPNTFTQEWVSMADGKEQPMLFKWTRKQKK